MWYAGFYCTAHISNMECKLMHNIDSHGVVIQDIQRMLQKFEEAKSWLESFGLNVTSARFQKYKKIIADKYLSDKFDGVIFEIESFKHKFIKSKIWSCKYIFMFFEQCPKELYIRLENHE